MAPLVWERFGDLYNYVEPFFGSGAVLLGSPKIHPAETVNDLDGFIANFWRSVAADPEAVAQAADWPVNENDLHARHAYLVEQREELTARLEGDPLYYDAGLAGWWVWGICCWIGGGWCSGEGPWRSVDGLLVKAGRPGVKRERPALGRGRGVHRKRPHICRGGMGVNHHATSTHEWMAALAARLRRVRVCCGDWRRVLGPSPTTTLGLTGVFLDPPYSGDERDPDIYALDSGTVAAEVREWALEHGDDPLLRIALCGYDGEHEMPGWSALHWKAKGGYGNRSNGRGRENASREVIWFSPGCLSARQGKLFD